MGRKVNRKYFCTKCNAQVFKYASCGKHIDSKGREDYAGLGGWRCENCKGKIKVRVEFI